MESREEWAARHHCAQTDFEELAWKLQSELDSVSLDPVRLRCRVMGCSRNWVVEEPSHRGTGRCQKHDDVLKKLLGDFETGGQVMDYGTPPSKGPLDDVRELGGD